MDISSILELLNREYGLELSSGYYTHVQRWLSWWRGFYPPFHQYWERGQKGTPSPRRLYSLRMAKKVCEDWADLLLNDKLTVALGHSPSNRFLQGENQNGGLFGRLGFWTQANRLVERAFSSGTCAMVLRVENLSLRGGRPLPSPQARIRLEYLDAMHIIPLSLSQGQVVEAAFVSEVVSMGRPFLYLETHTLENGSYHIRNRYFADQKGQLEERPLPQGLLPELDTGSDLPWFALLSPNMENPFPDAGGLGAAVFAQAEDCLRGVDLAYNNFCRDFALGGKKVFFHDPALLLREEESGQVYTPDDMMQQLFFPVADQLPGQQQAITEHNPLLRVAENREGVQSMLDYLSMRCGMGARHYRFDDGAAVTATQYVGSRQDLVQTARKHFILVERALTQIIRAILQAARDCCGLPVDPDTPVTVNFDDGVIVSDETRKAQDLQEVREGIMQKWEYRAKWYGEDRETAVSAVSAAAAKQRQGKRTT